MTIEGTKKRRRFGWIGLAIILVGMLLCVPVLLQDRNGNKLLSRARRVGPGVMQYQWLNNREILYAEVWRTAKPHNRIVKRNIETGVVTPIRAFESNQRNFGIGEMDSVLSPDGEMLIWIGSSFELLPLGSSKQMTFPHAASAGLNGKTGYLPTVAWLPDSYGWLEIKGAIGASNLVVHPLAGTGTVSVPLPSGMGMQRILGVTPQNKAIISRQRGAVVDEFLAISFDSNPPRVKNMQFGLPPSADIEEIVLSPQGDRLAWKTSTWNDWRSALSALTSGKPQGRNEVYAIWVSRLNGSDMRRLGSESLSNSGGSPIEHLRWLPDGRSVSFVYNNGLYTIPAD